MGRMRQVRTVKRHAQFQRFADTVIDTSNVFPAQLPDANDVQALFTNGDGARIQGLRRISEDTRNLLDAYDQYFTSQDELDTTLWVRQHTVTQITHLHDVLLHADGLRTDTQYTTHAVVGR
jgi:hypothetical protein